jgi:Putative RNA methylase family UPF0020
MDSFHSGSSSVCRWLRDEGSARLIPRPSCLDTASFSIWAVVAESSEPGQLAWDPMCGVGTSLIEAARLGRRAVGVELEPRWVDLARLNIGPALDADNRTTAAIDRYLRAFEAGTMPQAVCAPRLAELADCWQLDGGDTGMDTGEAADWAVSRRCPVPGLNVTLEGF